MKGENIVCFAKDWSEDPTSNNHVMSLLARDNRVLWLNSIATRTPNLASGRDVGKIARKLKSFFGGAERVRPNLWVVTPLVLPFPHSRLASLVNRWILRATISFWRWKLGMRDFQLWSFLPNVVQYVGKLGESLSVYYCTDKWSSFSYVEGQEMGAAEQELLGKVDICFATAHLLAEDARRANPNSFLASHGVDQEFFARALDPGTRVPGDVAGLPHPVVGFFGLIHDWIDLELIATVARAHPDWSVVLIGKPRVDVSALRGIPNIHLLGRKPYEELPGYCRAFDAGLIPFRINELTRHVNPIKLREYLSAGLPVVATDLPEVRHYPELCHVASSHDDFVRALERALREDSPARRRERSERMREETWDVKVSQLCDTVMRVKAASSPAGSGWQRGQRP